MTGIALILGTLAGQADAMRWLADRGWSVHSCGHRREGPGVDVADAFHLVDILDIDAVTRLAEQIGAGVVYSVGSDIAMPTIARVCDRLGLVSLHDVEVTDLLQRKDHLRAFLGGAGLSPVAWREVGDPSGLDGFTHFPAIVKPTDSQGQRGITVVLNSEEAARAIPSAVAASRSRTAVIEEFLAGPEVSVHVFVVEGEVRFFLPSDRHVWEGPVVGIPEAHSVPSRWLDDATRPVVEDMVVRFVRALGVWTGPLYFQLKLTPAGPRIIEVASRLDGCHLWRLVALHTGFDIMGACFAALAREEWAEPAPWDDHPRLVLGFHLASPHRAFHEADHPPPATGRLRFRELQVDEGARPRDVNGVVSRVGYYIVEEG